MLHLNVVDISSFVLLRIGIESSLVSGLFGSAEALEVISAHSAVMGMGSGANLRSVEDLLRIVRNRRCTNPGAPLAHLNLALHQT